MHGAPNRLLDAAKFRKNIPWSSQRTRFPEIFSEKTRFCQSSTSLSGRDQHIKARRYFTVNYMRVCCGASRSACGCLCVMCDALVFVAINFHPPLASPCHLIPARKVKGFTREATDHIHHLFTVTARCSGPSAFTACPPAHYPLKPRDTGSTSRETPGLRGTRYAKYEICEKPHL